MTKAERDQKKVERLEGLKVMQELQKDLGNTQRAEMMQTSIDELTLELK